MHEDLGFGEMPEGWSNQLDNDVLVNLNQPRPVPTWTAFGIAARPAVRISIRPGPAPVVPTPSLERPYFNVVARVRFVDEFVATEGGETQNGGYTRPSFPRRETGS